MKRGPKTGKRTRTIPAGTAPVGLGEMPEDLVGLGRQLWLDAVAHLEATDRAQTVHRTTLVLACRLVEGMTADAGLNRFDACRRMLHELGLTPMTSGRGAMEAPRSYEEPETGRARILSLIAAKARA